MAVASARRLSANIALMDHLVRALCRGGFSSSLSVRALNAPALRRRHSELLISTGKNVNDSTNSISIFTLPALASN
jgi:hypothetical protein